VDQHQARDDQQVPDVERVAAVGEEAGLDQVLGEDLPVLAAAADVGQADHQRAQALAGEDDQHAQRLQLLVRERIAEQDRGPRAERDRQEDQRKEQVPVLEEELADARQAGAGRGVARGLHGAAILTSRR
jgi:hypothetical protein